MKLRLLRTFVAVAEEGSFNAASKHLYTAHPAVGRQIRQLERHLRVTQFHRSSAGVELTDDGVRSLADARRILEIAAGMEDATDQNAQATMTLGVPEEGLQNLSPVVAAAHRAAHPDVELQFAPCDLTALTDMGMGKGNDQFDAIIWMTNATNGVLSTAVYSEPLCAAVSSESDLADADHLDPNDLLDEVFVASPVSTVAGDLYLNQLRNEVAPHVTTTSYDNASDVFSAVARGEGIMCASPGSALNIAPNLVRFIPFGRPILASTAVSHGENECRRHVLDLASIAASIGTSFHHLVPNATAPPLR